MLSQNLSEFFDTSLHLNCPQISLRKELINSQEIYQGSGSITRTSEGQLELKLSYFDDNSWLLLFEHIEELGEKRGSLTRISDKSAGIGKIVPESEYFSLSAIDSQGREWTSTRVLISQRSFQSNLVTLIAQLHEISYTIQSSSNEKASMCLQLCGDINIPHNTLMQTEEELECFRFPSLAHFFACGYEFFINHQNGITIIEVISDCQELPAFIETRVCEALQFVLSDFITWSTLELNQSTQRTIRIRSLLNKNKKTKLRPPIRFEKLDITKDIWKLYENYLQHILKDSERMLHPISGWIARIIEARTVCLESEMLTLSVAVESLLTIEPLKQLSEKEASLDDDSDDEYNNLQSQISLIQSVIEPLSIDNSLRTRLTGFLGNIKSVSSVSAMDRLRNLVDKGLLDKKLVDAWKDVRNSAAHGYVLEPEKFGKYHKLSNQVTVLFNHLVFLIIGYVGKYTDYREDGWIKKDYNRNSN
ncbi:hypothetical protein [Fischerella thermalis]|uniref:ApeA N-terminal domain-containing protein n=1 Tax=Fischerella thermalis CCMEE 5318 TaxID=2019666 RepID=A0A2N6L9Q7_9CYAN|nr:hypothetical protein [Fischerella thermalis]PMB19075.1 hypothetical protein CEN46_19475 [Fischerella thermalis CCMEE 5318]